MGPKSPYYAQMVPHLDQMKEWFNSGMLWKDIAAGIGIENPQKVIDFMASHGMIKKRISAAKVLDPNKNEILQKLHIEKRQMQDVAKEYGVSIAAISKARKRWMGDRWFDLKGGNLNLHEEDIITRWVADESEESIAKSYGVNNKSIHDALERWGCLRGY